MVSQLRFLLTLFTILCFTTIASASVQKAHAGFVFEKTWIFKGVSHFPVKFLAAKGADEFVNLASSQRTTHILTGDATGGGHLFPGGAGKSSFPQSWSADRVMHEISDVATDPLSSFVTGRGPTRLISPRRILKSCGNSSRLVARRMRPMGVMRGSNSSF